MQAQVTDHESYYLTPSPDGEKEKKKGNKKKALLLGLAALVALGGASVLCRSIIFDRPQPPREGEVAVMVEPTEIEYVVPLSPTPTEAEPIDVREAWYGNYDGTATGVLYRQWDEIDVFEFEDLRLWLQIKKWEDCGSEEEGFSFCAEDLSWGVHTGIYGCTFGGVPSHHSDIRLYLPADLSDAPSLTITEDKLTLTPTEEYPYEVVIERVNGQLEGYIVIDWDNPEYDPEIPPQKGVIDDFVTGRTADIIPCK